MPNVLSSIWCDGCGQIASPEHVARRLRRLEWATRYRPIHINALLLGAAAPNEDSDFLYAPAASLHGEAGAVLQATGLRLEGKNRDALLTEFQRGGFFVAHILECPFELNASSSAGRAEPELLQARLPFALSRIRRSLKPKSVIPISRLLEPLIPKLQPSELSCALVVDNGKPFALDGDDPSASAAIAGLRSALTSGTSPHSWSS